MVHKEFGDIFKRFIQIPILKNTYAEHFYQAFQFLPGHVLERNSNHLVLRYKVPQEIMNMNGSVHGGALATILDCATTIAILRGDKNLSRTVSIELGFSFISPAKLNDSLLVMKIIIIFIQDDVILKMKQKQQIKQELIRVYMQSVKKQERMLHILFVIYMKNKE
ncbi:unnamed protein product [Paramecium sonneborni]|uniref:Thioesterase domain-containing protein n=1 Tax=Paramecium sonneborni TaxID=65129 RepID=A0A8S1Q8B7_9CILI|nr:unnamed protein product [Paramecium sonneborni]